MGAVNFGARPRLVDASFENLMAVLQRENYRPAEIWSFVSMAARLPTIEAEPVKHGRWVWDSDNDRYACSRCNKEPSGDCNGGCVSHLSDYCPNCGAKMDVTDINVGNKTEVRKE